jgi:hypothetical protein
MENDSKQEIEKKTEKKKTKYKKENVGTEKSNITQLSQNTNKEINIESV